MLAGRIALLDLETTGPRPQQDRITEIGLIALDDGEPAGSWSTLVQPERGIPPFIARLTGIDDAMVAEAPRFAVVAHGLIERLAGRLLVAHNARFDYGFLRHEFRRAGLRFESDVLCSAKLSRRLYPQHHRHSLDALIARHGIVCASRHRALGDACALADFLRAATGELGRDAVQRAADRLTERAAGGRGRFGDLIDDLPASPGAYACLAADGGLLYLGRARNLRARVAAQLALGERPEGDRDPTGAAVARGRDAPPPQAIARIEYEPAAGPTGAALAELMMARTLAPQTRRAGAEARACWSWRLGEPAPRDDRAAPQLALVETSALDDAARAGLIGLFRTDAEARRALAEIARAHRLCRTLAGLEDRAPCSGRATQTCGGACEGPRPGTEMRASHYGRLARALAPLRLQPWPFDGPIGLREARVDGSAPVHVFDRWRYAGAATDEAELAELAVAGRLDAFDPDVYRLLRRALAAPDRGVEVLRLGPAGRTV